MLSGETPDYLPQTVENTGIVNLGRGDYKTPRILLLQGLSPQVQSFPGKAIPGAFWHTGLNESLGTEFNFVPLKASKKAILFRPRSDRGGGVLAISNDGATWATAANQRFRVMVGKPPVEVFWETGRGVAQSGLIEWGSSNPDDPRSPPAATLIYEYLCYLPEHPKAFSPCVLSIMRTGLDNARNFNTGLLLISNAGKPIYSRVITCVPQLKEKDGNKWTIPSFRSLGWATKVVYDVAKQYADEYKEYTVEYSQEEEQEAKEEKDF
jgi:hypothetical protein